jgi:hypothetical protein
MKFISPYNISLIILLDQCLGDENEIVYDKKLLKFVISKLSVHFNLSKCSYIFKDASKCIRKVFLKGFNRRTLYPKRKRSSPMRDFPSETQRIENN